MSLHDSPRREVAATLLNWGVPAQCLLKFGSMIDLALNALLPVRFETPPRKRNHRSAPEISQGSRDNKKPLSIGA